jgi:hypothetical protein
MPTTFSSEDGQVVRAHDEIGTYYYLADGLGNPTYGGWDREEDAIAALYGDPPPTTVEVDAMGRRVPGQAR